MGPLPINAAELASVTNLNDLRKYFVEVEIEEAADTGIEEVEQTSDAKTKQVTSEKTTAYDLAGRPRTRRCNRQSALASDGRALQLNASVRRSA